MTDLEGFMIFSNETLKHDEEMKRRICEMYSLFKKMEKEVSGGKAKFTFPSSDGVDEQKFLSYIDKINKVKTLVLSSPMLNDMVNEAYEFFNKYRLLTDRVEEFIFEVHNGEFKDKILENAEMLSYFYSLTKPYAFIPKFSPHDDSHVLLSFEEKEKFLNGMEDKKLYKSLREYY